MNLTVWRHLSWPVYSQDLRELCRQPVVDGASEIAVAAETIGKDVNPQTRKLRDKRESGVCHVRVSFIVMTEAPRRASRASGQGSRSARRRRRGRARARRQASKIALSTSSHVAQAVHGAPVRRDAPSRICRTPPGNVGSSKTSARSSTKSSWS